MNRKFLVILASAVLLVGSVIGFAAYRSLSGVPSFVSDGYFLREGTDGVKRLTFHEGESFSSTLGGTISFDSDELGKVHISPKSFAHLENGSVMATSDGILLDFNDLSANYINNYYISAKLPIAESNGNYLAETANGTMQFGEHVWKLADNNYIVQAPELKVNFGAGDVREVQDFVQVAVGEDQVVRFSTPENLWMTISENCYIETDTGVKVYPVSQIVDNGKFKLSLAKLSVSTDDAIILSESEQRRQIVPALNIQAIDGDDGEAGTNGRIGQAGENGLDGEAGEDGEDGDDGESGQDGDDGVSGQDGKSGESGRAGSEGDRGPDGEAGGDGDGGDDAAGGAAGKNGADAVIKSSTNSALPVVTLETSLITPTGIKGILGIRDEGEAFGAIGEIAGYETKYAASVTLQNLKTREVIPCYQAKSLDDEDFVEGDTGFDAFYTGAEEVFFSTKDGPLEPDTEYRLSVKVYYKMQDDSGKIYYREFVSENFYTDSTGVMLTKANVTESSISVAASVSGDYMDKVASITAYLLTPQQDENFSTASFSSTDNYVDKCAIMDGEIKTFPTSESIILTPNTDYVVRAYVETTDGLKMLTKNKLEVTTLKREMKKADTEGKPEVFYNRVTGAYEVWRPNVKDMDGGADHYVYVAYERDEATGEWKEASRRTVRPSEGEPVEFHLETAKTYQFGVELCFNDNEKLVYFDLGRSESIMTTGATMPKVTMEGTVLKEYDEYKGTIQIELKDGSSLAAPSVHDPMKISIFADQIQDSTVEIVQAGEAVYVNGKDDTMGTITLLKDQNQNYIKIDVDLKKLYKNTNYTLTLYGKMAFEQDGEANQRAIGTVSFRTYDVPLLTAKWSPLPQGKTAALGRNLSLSLSSSGDGNSDTTHALENLKQGQTTVVLYSGVGPGKLPVGPPKNFNKPDELQQLFSDEGYDLTEADFGNPPLDQNANYTLYIISVADETYNMDLGYVNDFKNITNDSEIVSAEPVPPDLLSDPTKAIDTVPILNKNAEEYGGKYDKNMPDDTVVGYALASTYDNVQRIGKSVTYYIYELNTFFNAFENNKDPIQDAEPLKKIELSIDSGSNKVPKIAVLFGGTESEVGKQCPNGYLSYWMGEDQNTGSSLEEGMGRGYRYIFAYTAEYLDSQGNSRTYPYTHKDYATYNRYYGGIKGNQQVGQGVAYILNSGIIEAPCIMPEFHSYVYDTEKDTLGGQVSEGRFVLRYKWRDPDSLIRDDGSANVTHLIYTVNTQERKEDLGGNHGIGDGWYEQKIGYYLYGKENPEVQNVFADLTNYKLTYDHPMEILGYSVDPKEYPIASIPVDWAWDQEFNNPVYEADKKLKINLDHLQENYIDFELVSTNNNIMNRAIAMELNIQKRGQAGVAPRKLIKSLKYELGKIAATVLSGELGNEYLGQEFEVTSAKLYYDTGRQGWREEITEAKPFALQYINDGQGEFGFSSYVDTINSVNIPANGGMLNPVSMSLPNKLQATVGTGKLKENDKKQHISLTNTVDRGPFYTYLYPSAMGVDASTSEPIRTLSERYIVPKEIGEMPLSFDGESWGALTTITPTISWTSYWATSDSVTLGGIEVAGLGDAGGKIYAQVYDTEENAKTLSADGTIGSRVEINIKPNGTPDGTVALKNLPAKNTKYYVAFYYMYEDKPVALIDRDAMHAVWPVVTSADVHITFQPAEYENPGYFGKKLKVEYSLSRAHGVSLEYAICLDVDGEEELMTYEELLPLLTVPNTPKEGVNNMEINLDPDSKRSKLEPGGEYFLKISAFETLDGKKTPVGEARLHFKLDNRVPKASALIRVTEATADMLKYQVTIIDAEKSLMTIPGLQGSESGGLYAVRFTDDRGHRIYTDYDNNVYCASQLRQGFELSDRTIKNSSMGITENQKLEKETYYIMNIYAIQDMMHVGSVDIVGEEKGKTWRNFFNQDGKMDDPTSWNLDKDGKTGFLGLINSFWDAVTPLPDRADTAAQVMIASLRQATTGESGWYVDTQNLYASRDGGKRMRVYFDGSFGLLPSDPMAEPIFKKIEWSISGYTDTETIDISDTLLYSKGNELIKQGSDAGGYGVYYMEIPQDISSGTWKITLHMYTNEDSVQPDVKFTTRGV